ncbi:MAG: glycosyltransferase, partial [Nitrospirales bacterium]|nr:glycosyltransferase [Nitrospirales bacterium]
MGLRHDLEARNAELITLKEDLAARGKEIVGLRHDLEARNAELITLKEDLAARRKEIIWRKNDLAAREAEIVNLKDNLASQQKENLNLEHVLVARDEQILDLQRTLVTRNKELSSAQELYEQVHEQFLRRSEWGLSLEKELETARRLYAQVHYEFLERTDWAISLNRELNDVYQSRKWRFMHPLVTLRQSVKRFCTTSPFCRTFVGGFFQGVFRSLPLSARIRVKSLFYGTDVGGAIFRGMKQLAQGIPSESLPNLQASIPAIRLDGGEDLHFNNEVSPVVSIVIPVYNHLDYTIRCLKAIQASDPQKSFEVIVVDDQSEDQTGEALKSITGLRVVTNKKNMGFIKSCNKGAEVAKGEFLLFLNNDTQVSPQWLDELVDTFRLVPEAGLVGAKLLYPDGTLQEAGGIIWNNGSSWNYGRNDDPRKPEYNYLREVDYCSGACLMVPRELFLRLGGFDEEFAPAYGEDSDLALKIKKLGRKVLYQPLAEVIHFEGVSSGTDLNQGIKKHQVTNERKLFERWHSVLAGHGSPGNNPQFERERHIQKRILVVDACTPTPDQDSGSFKIFNFIQIFQALSYKVTFVPDNLLFIEKYTPALQRMGVECWYWSYIKSLDEYLATYGKDFDVILSCRPNETEKHLGSYRKHCPRAKILYDTADLHFLREQRQAEIEGNPGLTKVAAQRKRQELGLVSKVDCTLVVSETEKQILLNKVPGGRVAVISAV